MQTVQTNAAGSEEYVLPSHVAECWQHQASKERFGMVHELFGHETHCQTMN
jgi:hypothetical protein